jgi:hypothetical protein
VIARHHTGELRFLVHWSAEVFSDYAEPRPTTSAVRQAIRRRRRSALSSLPEKAETIHNKSIRRTHDELLMAATVPLAGKSDHGGDPAT